MTITELGAIGELVGGVAVLVTLVYLAAQIRQNTKMVKMAAMESIVRGGVDHSRRMADNADLAEVIDRAVEAPKQITSVDRLRLNSHFLTLYHHLDAAFHMHRSGALDDEIWSKFAYEAPLWMNVPVVRDWFELEKQRLTPTFREFIESSLPTAPSAAVMPGIGRTIGSE